MDGRELALWAIVFILVVAAIGVPVGIHLSNNNKMSVPTNTPAPGGTGPPVPPIVPPQSGQAPIVAPPIVPPVPPIVQPSVATPKKYTYEMQDKDDDLVWGCQLPKGKFSSVSATALGGMGRGLLETECSDRADCMGYYDSGIGWLISTDKLPKDCDDKPKPLEKYPYFYWKKEKES